VSSDRDLWQRARPLFDELADLDGDVRRVRLTELTTGDPALHDLPEAMMRGDASAEDVLADYRFGLPQRMSSASDDAAVPSSDPLGILGQTVAHYRIVSYLAAGGMGAVYSADDLRLGRVVALKFPLPYQHTDAVAKERFMHEARSAAALDHPNLCSVYEIGESTVGVFLAMPLYAGETLETRLSRGRLSFDQAAQLTPSSADLSSFTSAMIASTSTCMRRMSILSMIALIWRICFGAAVMTRAFVSGSAQIIVPLSAWAEGVLAAPGVPGVACAWPVTCSFSFGASFSASAYRR